MLPLCELGMCLADITPNPQLETPIPLLSLVSPHLVPHLSRNLEYSGFSIKSLYFSAVPYYVNVQLSVEFLLSYSFITVYITL